MDPFNFIVLYYDRIQEMKISDCQIYNSLRNLKLKLGEFLIIHGIAFKVFFLNPLEGHLNQTTRIICYPSDLQQNVSLQKVHFMNLSNEKRELITQLPLKLHISKDQQIIVNGTLMQAIKCVPNEGIFTPETQWKIINYQDNTIEEIQLLIQNQTDNNKQEIFKKYIQPYFLVPRFIKEGSKIKIQDIELIIKKSQPKMGLITCNTQIFLIDNEQTMFKSLNEDDEQAGLYMQINTLKILEVNTASRNQFVQKRKQFYGMMENFAQYDDKENQIIFSSKDLNSKGQSINEFPNFPNTFLTKLHKDNEEIEIDLMDFDECNFGAGLHEQNMKLSQMTLPVLFKNIFQKKKHGANRQSQLQQPEQPKSDESFLDQSFESDANAQLISDASFLIQEDQPHLATLPRYFDDIVLFNQQRWLPVINDGNNKNFIQQFPERKIDLNWIQNKGQNINEDFCKCMICLMDYTDEEIVKTLPCLHYFHNECIDFWLAKSIKCPVCKYRCDEQVKF
ncbi:unnamed protein product (macronuclear) [Paramecium tetraurelia]|uniref:RING-type domain-containing protein n=1 Tax=Paramecium tetraurelia TaxID=5888 RepID=A0D6I1_PARTE|nr:uncharacterized protein GSPATT00001689001 [Paramecium tetraurelia]CAK78648.1 unnamed protein product [Paramecium tetraurelia]|eukprot:XP_001446045.1 hypothetical protein (macronuclear) [Paramecium tetraurelia strain d4-2]